jgi:hypothetical protein
MQNDRVISLLQLPAGVMRLADWVASATQYDMTGRGPAQRDAIRCDSTRRDATR